MKNKLSPVKRTVLIVEDDADMRAGIAAMMRAEGFEPVAIGEGEGALPHLDKQKFDLVLLDVELPGISGFDVLKLVKQHPQYQSIPVIMITAESKDNQVLGGYDLGADYYIPKPFTTKQLHYGLKLYFPE